MTEEFAKLKNEHLNLLEAYKTLEKEKIELMDDRDKLRDKLTIAREQNQAFGQRIGNIVSEVVVKMIESSDRYHY